MANDSDMTTASEENFITKRNDVTNALQEFKEACESEGEDFESEVEALVEDIE